MAEQYTPDRTVLAVAGNVDHEEVVALAAKMFERSGRAPRGRLRVPVNGYSPQRYSEERPCPLTHLVLGTRCLPASDYRRPSMSCLTTILGGGMSRRLNQNTRERYGFCYSIYSIASMHSHVGGFGAYLATDPGCVH